MIKILRFSLLQRIPSSPRRVNVETKKASLFLEIGGKKEQLEKDRERRVFLARFKQSGRFSSAENAAFKSRSASFARWKSSSWFHSFSLFREEWVGEGGG